MSQIKVKKSIRPWRNHVATFNGSHNHMKGRCLIVLYHRKEKLENTSGLSYAELAAQAGVNPAYVRSKIGMWVEWKYLNKKAGTNASGRPVFTYSIAERGVTFLEKRMGVDVLLNLVEEIKQTRTAGPG